MSENSNLRDELNRMAAEPLLPAEKKLIAASIALGVILLVLMVWLSRTYFGS